MTQESKPAAVRRISTDEISANPHNPRRLFDEEPMRILRESIQKLNILVPLTVYVDPKKRFGTEYVLLDGERRWRCAKELKIRKVPVIVVEEPSEERNILTMFHIHNVRAGWQLMPTALKLQQLAAKLGETNERILAELTKLKVAQIRRCKILLTYPKAVQNMMLAPQSERFKADFFIELQRIRGPALENKLRPWISRGDLACIKIFIDKYESDVIKAVTEFRRLAEIYRASEKIGKVNLFMDRFDQFLNDPEQGIYDIEVPGATFAKEAKEVHRSANRLFNQIQAIDLEEISSEEATINLLRRLMRLLNKKLDSALLLRARDVETDED